VAFWLHVFKGVVAVCIVCREYKGGRQVKKAQQGCKEVKKSGISGVSAVVYMW